MKRAPIKTTSGALPPPIPAHFADEEENHATEAAHPAPRRHALDAPFLAKNSCANWSPVIPALDSASPRHKH